MSCPVMHDQKAVASAQGGGCPVMHGSGSASGGSSEKSFNEKVFEACSEQIRAFNICQTRDVGADGSKSHCEPEALALRECELARRRREKLTKKFEDCVKNGGDSVSCLQEVKQ